MKNLNSEETLWFILPIFVVLLILIASIIILPNVSLENRTKASTPTPSIAPITLTPAQPSRPEIICSSLYSPVCGSNGKTYPNECEANQAGVSSFTKGECKPSSKTTTSPEPLSLPASN